jgi:protein-tyrosine phosphatase
MRAAAKKQGLTIEGSARQVAVEDFSKFDWIFCMDRDNLDELLGMGANADTTKLLLPFIHHKTLDEVPDPYYGGEDGFENVVRLIREATTQLTLKLCD